MHLALCGKGFTATGYTENKGVAVQKLLAVCDNHIVADDILTVVDTVLMENILHPERNKYRKAFRCQCSEASIFLTPEGHYRVKPVYLLKSQKRQLAQDAFLPW